MQVSGVASGKLDMKCSARNPNPITLIKLMHNKNIASAALGSFIHHSYLLTNDLLLDKNLQKKCEISK
jgi:hypothetical protein